jgi:hypothetical protein
VNPYLALYLKELKGIRLVSAVFIVVTTTIVLIVLNDASDGGVHGSMVLLFLPYLSPPLLAGLLIQSITQEWAGNTQHQWLALPVPRATLLLTKLAAVLTLAAGILVLNTFAVHMVYEQVLAAVDTFRPPPGFPADRFDATDLWTATVSMFGSVTLLLSGLGLIAASLKTVVFRFRGLVTVSVFLGGLWLTGRLAPGETNVVSHWEPAAGPNLELAGVLDGYLYVALMGVVFSAVGLYLFDRYADA